MKWWLTAVMYVFFFSLPVQATVEEEKFALMSDYVARYAKQVELPINAPLDSSDSRPSPLA